MGVSFAPAAAASLVVKVYPERVLTSRNSPVTLRCQVSGHPPHYFFWSREDGRSISGSAERRRQGAPPPRRGCSRFDPLITLGGAGSIPCCAGAELYFPSVQPNDAGVYVCTCRDQRGTNRSRAEIVVTSAYAPLPPGQNRLRARR